MKTFTTMLTICWAILFSGCAITPKTDPVKYGNQLLATLNGNGKYVQLMNEAVGAKDYPKAETISKSWSEQLDKSLAEVEQILPLKNDAGLRNAVKKGLESYKRVATSEFIRLIYLRRQQIPGDDTLEPQILSMVNRIRTSVEAIEIDLANAESAFEQRFGKL